MERKLLSIFKEICEINDKIIEKQEVQPMCFLISKKYKLTPVLFSFKNQEEKQILRGKIKKLLLELNLKGYILIMDAKMTMFDKTKKKAEVTDVILRNLYTAKEVRREWVTYKNKKIVSKKKMPIDRRDKKFSMQDEWDLWGVGVDSKGFKKEGFDYHHFKMANKKLYDGVVEPFEDYTRIFSEKDKKNIIFAYKFNHEEGTIRYYLTDEFKEVSKKKDLDIFKFFRFSRYKLIELNKDEEEI